MENMVVQNQSKRIICKNCQNNKLIDLITGTYNLKFKTQNLNKFNIK